jgi:hypothetical protein
MMLKVVRVLTFLLLLTLTYVVYILAQVSEIGCTVCPPPVVGKSYLTRATKTYENGTPPWHVKVIKALE